MIIFDPFWNTMKSRNISSYKLQMEYSISKSMIFKLRHNKNLELATINELCNKFKCDLHDVIAYIPDEEIADKE